MLCPTTRRSLDQPPAPGRPWQLPGIRWHPGASLVPLEPCRHADSLSLGPGSSWVFDAGAGVGIGFGVRERIAAPPPRLASPDRGGVALHPAYLTPASGFVRATGRLGLTPPWPVSCNSTAKFGAEVACRSEDGQRVSQLQLSVVSLSWRQRAGRGGYKLWLLRPSAFLRTEHETAFTSLSADTVFYPLINPAQPSSFRSRQNGRTTSRRRKWGCFCPCCPPARHLHAQIH